MAIKMKEKLNRIFSFENFYDMNNNLENSIIEI